MYKRKIVVTGVLKSCIHGESEIVYYKCAFIDNTKD